MHDPRLVRPPHLLDSIRFRGANESEGARIDKLLDDKEEQILDRSKPFAKFMLGRIATNALRSRAWREVRDDLYNERREALGYKGRIVEDGIAAATARYTRTPLHNKAEAAERGERSPITDETPDGFWSMYARADSYPELAGYMSDNQGFEVRGFRFAVAADESQYMVTHPTEEHADLYLVINGNKKAVRVDERLFEQIGNRTEITSDFEKLAEDLKNRGKMEAFMRHLDRHL